MRKRGRDGKALSFCPHPPNRALVHPSKIKKEEGSEEGVTSINVTQTHIYTGDHLNEEKYRNKRTNRKSDKIFKRKGATEH